MILSLFQRLLDKPVPATVLVVSLLWAIIGYSLAFTGDGPWIGSLDRLLLMGMGLDSVSALATTLAGMTT